MLDVDCGEGSNSLMLAKLGASGKGSRYFAALD